MAGIIARAFFDRPALLPGENVYGFSNLFIVFCTLCEQYSLRDIILLKQNMFKTLLHIYREKWVL